MLSVAAERARSNANTPSALKIDAIVTDDSESKWGSEKAKQSTSIERWNKIEERIYIYAACWCLPCLVSFFFFYIFIQQWMACR